MKSRSVEEFILALATQIKQKKSCDDLFVDLMEISSENIIAQEFLLLLLLKDISKNQDLKIFAELEQKLFDHLRPILKETLKNYLASIITIQAANSMFQPNQPDPIKAFFLDMLPKHDVYSSEWLIESKKENPSDSPFLNFAKTVHNSLLSSDFSKIEDLDTLNIVAILAPTQVEKDKKLITTQFELILNKLYLCKLLLTSFNSCVSTFLEDKSNFNTNLTSQIITAISGYFHLLSSYSTQLLDNDLSEMVEKILAEILEIRKTNLMQGNSILGQMLLDFVSKLPNASLFCAISYQNNNEIAMAYNFTSIADQIIKKEPHLLNNKYLNTIDAIESEFYRTFPPETGPEFSIV